MKTQLYETIKITNLKEMLNNTKEIYKNKTAYKIKDNKGNNKEITHKEVREIVDALGTALINMGLRNKRIAIIGENRYEWEIAYLSIVCGTGIVVPLDKALPENELEELVARSEIEAIFYSSKYENTLKNIKDKKNNKLKYLFPMDTSKIDGAYTQKELINKGKELIKDGNKEFINATIDNEKMSIMLFTSGTTSGSKVVALSHKNICSNLMDIGNILDVTEEDVFLSVLPVHHVFECTVGFLFSLYKGATTVFCEGIRHIADNLKEYKVTVMACVPVIYERILRNLKKEMERQGKLENILEKEAELKNYTIQERKKEFQEIHDMLGGNIKLLISGAAAISPKVEEEYRLLGFNLVQAYGLTETSPVVAIGTNTNHKIGSIGKTVPSVEVKIVDVNNEGIGELIVKGPNIALGYYNDKKATSASFKGEWFHTGDLAKIDEDGYIYICGRKKSVIVLKNGKNIFPEEMEMLVNKVEGVKESFIFGKPKGTDKDNIKVNVKVVYDKEVVKSVYNVETEEEIYKQIFAKVKEVNRQMPRYKAIQGMILTEEPLIKTTTNKIKRQANLDEINKFEN